MVAGAIKHSSAASSSTRSQRASRSRRRDQGVLVTLAQGGYFAVTGIWPLVSMRGFEWVTGPRTGRWLVKTVGALNVVIGVGLNLWAATGR